LESLSKDKGGTPELIGQFGVGFYSAFMVADKVTVITKKAGDSKAYKWESAGLGEYTTEECEKENSGTEITLHINKDNEDYLDEYKIKDIVKKYSDFIDYPIVMDIEKIVPVENDKDDAEDKEQKTEKKIEEEILNSQKAIWMRSASKIKKEEYNEFYKHISHDFQDPYDKIHSKVEGTIEYTSLLYIPSHMPFDLMFSEEKAKGIQLYVKKVFIMDDIETLMPRYLRFIKGVVDSSDLPLNVSREILQKERILQKIKKNLVKKVIKTFKEKLSKDRDGYTKFYKELGSIIKEGVVLDHENQKSILDVLLFESSTTKEGEFTTLEEYVDRMKKDQKEIFIITGTSRQEVESSPYIESLKEKGYEVLFLTDTIDEYVSQNITEYKEKKFSLVSKGKINLDNDNDKEKNDKELSEKETEMKPLTDYIGERFKDDIKEVRVTNRLVSSPSCLVADENAMSVGMEQLMRSMGQDIPKTKRIMEINPNNELIQIMNKMVDDKKEKELEDMVEIIYGQSVLAEGGKLKNPAKFNALITKMLITKS